MISVVFTGLLIFILCFFAGVYYLMNDDPKNMQRCKSLLFLIAVLCAIEGCTLIGIAGKMPGFLLPVYCSEPVQNLIFLTKRGKPVTGDKPEYHKQCNDFYRQTSGS